MNLIKKEEKDYWKHSKKLIKNSMMFIQNFLMEGPQNYN